MLTDILITLGDENIFHCPDSFVQIIKPAQQNHVADEQENADDENDDK
tara:strand:+ start:127 stop:270 length:144 start_codon:yes stop_codon:yes gene_type:complete